MVFKLFSSFPNNLAQTVEIAHNINTLRHSYVVEKYSFISLKTYPFVNKISNCF